MARCGNKACRAKYDASGRWSSLDNWCSDECRLVILKERSAKNMKQGSPLTGSSKLKSSKPLKAKTALKAKSSLKTTTRLKGLPLGSMQANKAKKAKLEKKKEKGVLIAPLKVEGLTLAAAENKAVKVCHAYIRLRDINELCICCNKPLGPDYQAGHHHESGNNSEIRFDEDNIHGQRFECNMMNGGDSGDYDKNLRIKIGDERVERLDKIAKRSRPIKRTIEDYLAIISYFEQKSSELKVYRVGDSHLAESDFKRI